MKAKLFDENGIIREILTLIEDGGGKHFVRSVDLTQDEYNRFRAECADVHPDTPADQLRHVSQIAGVRLYVDGVEVDEIAKAEFQAQMEAAMNMGALEIPGEGGGPSLQ